MFIYREQKHNNFIVRTVWLVIYSDNAWFFPSALVPLGNKGLCVCGSRKECQQWLKTFERIQFLQKNTGDLEKFLGGLFRKVSFLRQLFSIIPVPLRRVRTTRSSTHSHPFQVLLPISRTLSHKSSFIPRTCNLWNVLPSSCFPESYNLPSFKSKINKLDLISLSS